VCVSVCEYVSFIACIEITALRRGESPESNQTL